jgi:hypothetical protein
MHRIILILLSVFVLTKYSNAQGCSDAGFCTVGSNADISSEKYAAKKDSSQSSPKKHFVKVGVSVALGEQSVFILTPHIEGSFQINPRSSINIKTNLQAAFGKQVTKFGMGDITISHSTNLLSKTKHQLVLNIGAKLATGRATAKDKNKFELPMVYQSSLGTFDLLLGLNYKFNYKLGVVNIATGYQQPLIHINRNSVIENFDTLNAKSFIRKGDVFLRIDKIFTIKKKFDIGVGALAIYHILKDEIVLQDDSKQAINGSQGLTLNITALFGYRINDKIEIGLSAGFPVLVRDVRPDGLTRKFAIAPAFTYRF